MDSRGEEASQLKDAEWIIDLAFLMDTGKQKHLNYGLKGEGKTVCDTTRAAEAYNVRFNIFSVRLMRRKWRSPLSAVRANDDASGALEETVEKS